MIKSEVIKLKKEAMFFVGSLITVCTPIFIVLKDFYLSTSPHEILEWIMSCCLINFMVLSVLSGFIITNLIHKEYQSGTIINILTSLASRLTFILSKLMIWGLWYFIMLFMIILITIFGSKIIYPMQFDIYYVKMTVSIFVKFGLLSFISSIPLLWVTIMQKKLFYPSILTAIGFTIILAGGMNISLQMILPACIVPWSAVPIISIYQVSSPYMEIGLTSIILSGLISFFMACLSFNRQDQ